MALFSKLAKLQRDEHRNYLCFLADLKASYARCRSLRVLSGLTKPQEILPEVALAPLLVTHSLLLTAFEQVITPVCCASPQKNYLCILCDPDLVALEIFAAPEVLAAAEETGTMPGTVFTEESCGTNAFYTIDNKAEIGYFLV